MQDAVVPRRPASLRVSWDRVRQLTVARSCVLLAAYYAAARLGLALQFAHSNVTPVWPASGVAVAALLLLGLRYWPILLGASFLLNVTTGLPPAVAAGLASGNTLEYVLAAAFLRRAGFDLRLHSVRDVALLAVAGMVAPVAAATIGTASLLAGRVISSAVIGTVWSVYLIGDGVGILIVVPALITWIRGGISFPATRSIRIEAVCLAAIVLGFTWFVFFHSIRAGYLVYPLAIWAAVRFGKRGATLTMLGVGGVAILGTIHGGSPLPGGSITVAVEALQLFLGAFTVTSLVLAAVAEGRREAEGLAAERADRLETANRDLEAFAYSVAHDLRAPLRALDGYADALKEELAPTLSDEAERNLDCISVNASLMGSQIDALLNFSRLGTRPLKLQKVAPAAIARDVFNRLVAGTSGRQIEFAVADLPPCLADSTLLNSVYQNLLENALKFTREREVARIEVGWLPDESTSSPVYYVRDNGAGFDMQYSDRLFEVFARLHKQDRFPGTGAGLAITKRIVTRHGGRIWATAELDRGATFYFSL